MPAPSVLDIQSCIRKSANVACVLRRYIQTDAAVLGKATEQQQQQNGSGSGKGGGSGGSGNGGGKGKAKRQPQQDTSSEEAMRQLRIDKACLRSHCSLGHR